MGEYVNSIDGWMTTDELNWLLSKAKTMRSIVEVGSWKGRTTHALLTGCPGDVYAVDHWLGSEGKRDSSQKEATEKDVYSEFLKNVGHFNNLRVLKMDSVEASAIFDDQSVDMVFIDGGHKYREVKKDIESWLPKARRMMCGHDYGFASVRKAVKERFGSVDSDGAMWSVNLEAQNAN